MGSKTHTQNLSFHSFKLRLTPSITSGKCSRDSNAVSCLEENRPCTSELCGCWLCSVFSKPGDVNTGHNSKDSSSNVSACYKISTHIKDSPLLWRNGRLVFSWEELSLICRVLSCALGLQLGSAPTRSSSSKTTITCQRQWAVLHEHFRYTCFCKNRTKHANHYLRIYHISENNYLTPRQHKNEKNKIILLFLHNRN